MPFYHYLNRPGFTTASGVNDTIAPSDDRKNYIKLSEFRNTTYLNLNPNVDRYRAIPIIGFKDGQIVFGIYLDSGNPNYEFIEGKSNVDYHPTRESWGQFLSSLDSYIDFSGLYSVPNEVVGRRLNVHSQGKELLLVIDMRDGVNTAYLDTIDENSHSEEYLEVFALRYNTVSIPEINSIRENVDQLDSAVGSAASSFISR